MKKKKSCPSIYRSYKIDCNDMIKYENMAYANEETSPYWVWEHLRSKANKCSKLREDFKFMCVSPDTWDSSHDARIVEAYQLAKASNERMIQLRTKEKRMRSNSEPFMHEQSTTRNQFEVLHQFGQGPSKKRSPSKKAKYQVLEMVATNVSDERLRKKMKAIDHFSNKQYNQLLNVAVINNNKGHVSVILDDGIIDSLHEDLFYKASYPIFKLLLKKAGGALDQSKHDEIALYILRSEFSTKQKQKLTKYFLESPKTQLSGSTKRRLKKIHDIDS